MYEVDKQKWPDMRGFINYCHSCGIKVLLWLQAWTIEGLSNELCIKNNGKAVCMDPSNPDYREVMEKGVEYMLSEAQWALNADGLKIDGTEGIPSGKDVKTYGDIYGYELQHLYTEILYKRAVQVKTDALISLYIANPYFRDVCNIVRLGDYYSSFGRPVDALADRAQIVRVSMKGKPIDTDGCFRFSVADNYLTELDEQVKYGIPCLYQAENVYQDRSFVKTFFSKLTKCDYANIDNIFKKYLKQQGI